MKIDAHTHRYFVILLVFCGAFRGEAQTPIITAGDPVVAFDEDISSNSSYPGNESPNLAVDGSTATKYLNFGRENSGLIITPAFGQSALRSCVITTANDSPDRDPAGVIIYGTNSPILSTDNSAGSGESWTRIAELSLTLSTDRFFAMTPANLVNDEVFTSYKFVFTQMRGPAHNSMQISEIQAWDENDGQGQAIFGATDTVLAIHEASPESSFPGDEGPENLFDGLTSTKYLNFGRENSGFIVTPSIGATVAGSFVLSSANDAEGRDPIEWRLFGTNAPIVTQNNGNGQNEPWTLIEEGQIETPLDRFAAAPEVFFDNNVSYTSYKFQVVAIRTPEANSTQYSEFQLFGEAVAGEIVISRITLDQNTNQATIIWDAPAGGTYELYSSADLINWGVPIATGLQVENDRVLTFQPPVGDTLFYRLTLAPNNQ